MKKLIVVVIISLFLLLIGCKNEGVAETYSQSEAKGIVFTYYKLKNGSYQCEDKVYDYRLELTGRMPNAAKDSKYVVLTNDDSLTFEEVSQSIYSSLITDNDRMKDSKIVEMK